MTNLRIDFAIIGAPKCGSTSLYDYFAQHESVYAVAEAKDFPVFSRPNEVMDRLAKLGCFGYASNTSKPTVVGDANISFAKSHLMALKRFNPDVRVILLIRAPRERIKSSYTFNLERLLETRSLSVALNEEAAGILPSIGSKDWLQKSYFRHTDYQLMLSDCCELFGEKNVLVLDFDDLVERFSAVLPNLENFTGIKFGHLDSLPKSNVTAGQMRFKMLAKLLFQGERSSWIWKLITKLLSQKMRSRLRFLIRALMRKQNGVKLSIEIDDLTLSDLALSELQRLENEYISLKSRYCIKD